MAIRIVLMIVAISEPALASPLCKTLWTASVASAAGLLVSAGSAAQDQVYEGYRVGTLTDYSSCEIAHPNSRCRSAQAGYGELTLGEQPPPGQCQGDDCAPNFDPWTFVFQNTPETDSLLSFLHDFRGRKVVIEYYEPPAGMVSPGFLTGAMLLSIGPFERNLHLQACQSSGGAQGQHVEQPFVGYVVGMDLKASGTQAEWHITAQSEDQTRYYVWQLEEKAMAECVLSYLKSGQKGRFYRVNDTSEVLAAVRP